MVAGQPQTRDVPACDIAKPDRAARRQNSRQRGAARVRCPKYAPHAGPRNVRNPNVVLLKNLQRAKVRESARESAPQRQPDAGPRFRSVRRMVRKIAHNATTVAPAAKSLQWNTRIEFPVRSYLFQDCTNSCGVIPNSTEILVRYPLCTIAARCRASHSQLAGGNPLRERRWTLHISRG